MDYNPMMDILRVCRYLWLLCMMSDWSDHGQIPNYGKKSRQMEQLASIGLLSFLGEAKFPRACHPP